MQRSVLKFLCFLTIFFSINTFALEREDRVVSLFDGRLNLKVSIFSPEKKPIQDVIFLNGYYDRMDNHLPLFEDRVRRGFRVISFDYPSHGDGNSGALNFLSAHHFSSIYKLIFAAESETRESKQRPLALEGWSLGAQLIVRLMQSGEYQNLNRPISSLTLLAPAVAVRPIVRATRETLTSNDEYPLAPQKPSSPFTHFPFTLSLLFNCKRAQCEPLPLEVPTLVMNAGRDRYVSTKGVKIWADDQRKRGAQVEYLEFPQARHLLEAEDSTVIPTSGDFLERNCRVAVSRLIGGT